MTICVSVTKPTDLPFTEWRLDLFESLDNLPQSKNTIFTWKNGSQEQLMKVAHLQPAYMDLDIGVPQDLVAKIRSMGIKVIRSFHDYEKTPENLSEVLRELQSVPADYYKIACFACSTIETLSLVAFAKEAPKNCLLMTMGDTGYISRILAPVMGRPFTYACDDVPVVPGQLSYQTLENIYGYSRLAPATKIYGLIGNPVDKSPSYISHNRAMQEHKLSSVYVKIPVETSDLTQFFTLARQIGIRGLSVTMPHKEEVMKYCSTITKDAQAIGAVNTLVMDGDAIVGSNTDGPGAYNAIARHTPIAGKNVLVLGAGGAAKAIAWQLHQCGANVTISNRDKQKAENLARSIGCKAGEPSDYSIIINATSVGMPIEARYIIPGSYAMDVRTIPKDTEFLQEAKKRDCHIIYGYEMFIQQAILQFKAWFGDVEVSNVLTQAVLQAVR